MVNLSFQPEVFPAQLHELISAVRDIHLTTVSDQLALKPWSEGKCGCIFPAQALHCLVPAACVKVPRHVRSKLLPMLMSVLLFSKGNANVENPMTNPLLRQKKSVPPTGESG